MPRKTAQQKLWANSAWLRLGGLLVAAILLAVAAAKFAYFPGDVVLAQFVQALSGANVGWAQWVTRTVSTPYNYLLVAVSALLSWRIAGWRAALLAMICFLGLWQAEPWLKGLIARPRPAASLVRVTGSVGGFSFPSGFALIYFSTVGWLAVLAYHRLAGNARQMFILVCSIILLIGGNARVALGAHWPSDIYGAYLIGLVWAELLLLAGLRNR